MLQRLRGIKNYGRMLIIESGWSAYGYSLYYSSNVSKCFKFFINKKRNSKIIKVGNLMGQEEVPQTPCRKGLESAPHAPCPVRMPERGRGSRGFGPVCG